MARNCKLGDKGVVNPSGFIAHEDSCDVNPAALDNTALVGTGAETGADEDDFHMFKRKSAQVDREQKTEERVQKSGPRNWVQHKKKVVNF